MQFSDLGKRQISCIFIAMNILRLQLFTRFLSFLLLILVFPFSISADGNDNNGKTDNESNIDLDLAIEVLSKYLQYPSVTGQEKLAGQFLADFSEANGLFVKKFSEQEGQYNFAASLYPLIENKPNIIFLNHIDVVAAEDAENWIMPPFSGHIDDTTIWGRGALDCKGLAVMQLMALLNFKNKTQDKVLPFNVTMLAVSNEEVGGEKGAKFIVDNYLNYLSPMVVFGEGGVGLTDVLEKYPTAQVFTVSIAEKSNLWLKLSVNQECISHASTPANVYANKTLINALNKLNSRKIRFNYNESNKRMFRELGKIEGGLKGFVLRNINWTIFQPFVRKKLRSEPVLNALVSNTITVTQIKNPPGPPNSVSSNASATLDCRLLPGTSRKAFVRKVKKWIDEPAVEISVINEGPDSKSTFPGLFYNIFKQATISVNLGDTYVLPVLFPATSDNSYFRAAGVPVYGIIPAVLDRHLLESVHGANERIPVRALNTGIKTYLKLLEGVQDHFPAKTIDIETKN